MTVPDQQGPTLADLALNDLAAQLADTARKLAVLRAQYQQLAQFVDSKAEVLGLTRAEDPQVESSVNGSAVETEAADQAKWPNTKK